MKLRCVMHLSGVLLVSGMNAEGAEPSPGVGPASAKWMGKPVQAPGGGEIQTTIYYGPWQCNQRWMNLCQNKCASQGHKLMGCIWVADIKTDWRGRYLGFPAAAGGRYAITHCCCDYPEVEETASLREQWTKKRESFRRKWGEEFGGWPTNGDTNYPGITSMIFCMEETPLLKQTSCLPPVACTRCSISSIPSATKGGVHGARSVPTGPTRIEFHASPVPPRRDFMPSLPEPTRHSRRG